MLKVGGEIVYSTCSIAPEENELVIDRLLKNYPMEIVSPLKKLSEQFDPGLTIYKNKKLNPALQSAIRIFPDHHQMEGFFMIKLRKTASISHAPSVNFSGWKQTFSADHPSVSKILGELSDSWGIPYNEWMKYRYYLTATRIWMISQEIDIILHDGFISAGLLLAERRITGWKLVHGSIQYFSKFIRNRTMTLDDASLIKLFKDGRLIQLDIPDGYYALTYKDEPIASVYAETGQLLIRLPHAFNLVL
jgi:16S rRNA (cytosine1407-C5)-methyltransferase